MKIAGFFFSVFIFLSSVLFAQEENSYYKYLQKLYEKDSTQVFQIKTNEGLEFIGKVIALDSLNVKILTFNKVKATIPVEEIVSVNKYSKELPNGGFLSDRLFLGFTGNMVSGGTIYLTDVELFFPEVFVGITDYLMFGVGTPLIFDSELKAFYFTAKVQLFTYKSFNSAIGAKAIFGNSDFEVLPFAAGTVNLGRIALTVGALKWGVRHDGEIFPYFGGTWQLSKKLAFVTEEWVLDEDLLYSFGIRFTGSSIGVDLGLFRTVKANNPIWTPWLGASVKL